MKIIVDTSTIQDKMSGTGYYTLGMLQELAKMDSIEAIHTLGGSFDFPDFLNSEKIIRLYPGEIKWHRLLNVRLLANQPNLKADAAIFPNYFMPYGFSIPSIVTIHDLSFISHPHLYSRKMKSYYQHRIHHTFKNADRILTVSNDSRAHILNISSRQTNDIISIPPGPSLPFTGYNVYKEFPHKYFLMNGNIELRKNVIPTIRAFLESDLDDFHLVIVGKKFCRQDYWREFKQLLKNSLRVHYLGYLENEELRKWYLNASGIVCCSIIEGFGIPALNAQALNKPSLISNVPALKEAAGDKAIVVNPHNQLSISKGFELMAEFGLPKVEQAIDQYSVSGKQFWMQFSQKLENVLHETALNSKDSVSISTYSPDSFDLKKSVLKTLSYSAVFGAPLKLQECYLELHERSCTYEQYRRTVWELRTFYPDLIQKEEQLIGLKPFIKSFDTYKKAISANSKMLNKHRELLDSLKKLPWISGIYFSGGTVHSTSLSKEDIDLFIVSKANRVWLLYTLLKYISRITKSEEVLCFNYLIDEKNLHIKEQQDLYTAHQIFHLKPAFDDIPQPDLKAANPWIYDFFPNAKPDSSPEEDLNKNKGFRNYFMEFINITLMSLWGLLWSRKGVKNRTEATRWDAHQIKLHTRDHRSYVFKEFDQITNDVLHSIDEKVKN